MGYIKIANTYNLEQKLFYTEETQYNKNILNQG